jgi:hypothetical protein
MSAEFIKTVVYLERSTRQELERYAGQRGVSVSQAVREMVLNHVSDRLVLEPGAWFQLAIGALLRYHPSGDLEKVVREGMALERMRHHG